MSTPNTPANGGQILTDERIDSAWVAVNNGWGIVPRELIRKYARAIEADLRAALAAVMGKGEPEMWRVRYLCTAILNNCVVDETKRDARMVYDAIEGKSAAPAIPTVDRNAVLKFADWMNEPSSREETPGVRDYRFEAYRRLNDALKSAAPASVPQAQDLFDGDDAALCNCIHALLAMDQAGALVPHGIGGHARTLLATAALRLTTAQSDAQGAAKECQFADCMCRRETGCASESCKFYVRATQATVKTAEGL